MAKITGSHKARFSPHARVVLERRYLKKDSSGRVTETPAEMLERVASTVARADEFYGAKAGAVRTASRFLDLLTSMDFLPNSPTLMNAGRDLGQLAACFVLPVEDSIESIFNAVRDTALIHKSGGGTGFSFSEVRPARDLVKSTHGVSSGPISFMHVFDVATETIKQGGVRRGANMGILSVHHPDILEFIEVKSRHPERFANFNLSVSVTDAFMEAALAGRDYDLVNPHLGRSQGRLSAAEVLDRIVAAAWDCGDPGLVFIDHINQANPLPHLGPMEATNPCGEQPLLPYESCTLGSINLPRFVHGREIDYGRLGTVIRQAVHFLDNVIDVNRYPLDRIEQVTRQNRKIGLGVMGLADMLIGLGVPYDTRQALDLCREIMSFLRQEARAASSDLARKRGNFPSFEGSVYRRQGWRHMRNATTTTIAPTGSISIIAGCSSGIEPLFALAYRRRVLDDRELIEVHTLFKKIAKQRGIWSQELAYQLAGTGSLRSHPEVPEDLRRLFVTAHDLAPEWHLQVQAAFQAHTDNAVSKTVNLPEEATPETVRSIFVKAYELDLKGVTIYRDGSKAGQVLSFLKDFRDGGRPTQGVGTAAVLPPEAADSDEEAWFCQNCSRLRC
jgi:ribonucleoside-diphosphate reductase alpha chain